MFQAEQRGLAMSLFAAAPFMGPVIGERLGHCWALMGGGGGHMPAEPKGEARVDGWGGLKGRKGRDGLKGKERGVQCSGLGCR